MIQIPEQFQKIRRFSANGHRAPHKPLLILYALAQWQKSNGELSFEEIEEPLNELIRDFGGIGNPRSQYPFIRLCNDHVWVVKDQNGLILPSTKDYSPTELKRMKAVGSFTPELIPWLSEFKNREALIQTIILENFPETYHYDLIDRYNLVDPAGSMYISVRKTRNPEFRNRILDAYQRSCAICGYQIRKGDQLVGLEAAHIKWHAAGGPDIESNGLALCATHHRLFDYGLFSLNSDFEVLVSHKANGLGSELWLEPYLNRTIRLPRMSEHVPSSQFIEWHREEVYVRGM